MYCSEKCCNREGKRQQRAAEAQGRILRLCEVCGEVIPGGRTNQKVHNGECAKIARLKRCKKYRRANAKTRPTRECVCEICQELFITAYPQQVTCKKQKCRNEWHRKRRKELYASLDQDKKKNYIKKVKESDEYKITHYQTPTQTVKAKCPGCGKIFDAEFEVAYLDCVMPRVRCEDWPSCIKHLDNSDYAILPSQAGWQTDNRAYI
jgi:hypothetical protein